MHAYCIIIVQMVASKITNATLLTTSIQMHPTEQYILMMKFILKIVQFLVVMEKGSLCLGHPMDFCI